MRGVVLCLAALAATAFAYEGSVYGAQALKIYFSKDEEYTFIREHESLPGFDFLRVPHDKDVPFDVLVSPDNLDKFKQSLIKRSIKYEVFVEDVAQAVNASMELNRAARRRRNGGSISLRSFPRYDEIEAYLRELASKHSDIAQFFSIGKSYEDRDLVGIKISSGGDNNKNVVFIEGGIHAREWIAPTTALYTIQQLVENPDNEHIFADKDIYVIPSINPDGYEFTHKNMFTRLWRKTRSRIPGHFCRGVDANRNFGTKWANTSKPCSDGFAGTKAFSEPETAALRDFVLPMKGRIKVYLSLHSYGNFFLHPWGYTKTPSENDRLLACVAEKAAAQATKIRGAEYKIGSPPALLYTVTGGSLDWAMADVGAELSYTAELSDGRDGFAPSPSEIIPVGREFFEAFKVFASHAIEKVC